MMLVATAGHIDHGKTALIRALTGVETDRLPEEKARGISIDLGFAYWRPDAEPIGGSTIGFVDVPGHERFVRNMIAGLNGIGFALLVVAADDGIMPQTIEHLQILQLLGISRGAVVLTKIDRVDAARIAQVRADLAELLAPTALAGAAFFAVSCRDGSGIADLAQALVRERQERARDDARGFRLAIDRCFSIAGAGTIATGTVVAGQASLGDTLVLSPKGNEVRIRGMQSAGRKVDAITAGQRCALNLTGVEVGDVHRGDWLVGAGSFAPSMRIEADIQVLAGRGAPLRHGTRVHLHHGTASIGARILTPRQRAIAPGAQALAQLVLDAPTSAVIGERFVLRDQSGRELLGGGRVLDPLPAARRQSLAVRQARAAALALPEPGDALAMLASAPGVEPDREWFGQSCNLTKAALDRILASGDYVLAGRRGTIAIAADRFIRLGLALVSAIARHHQDYPAQGGLSRRAGRGALGEPVSAELFGTLVRDLLAAKRIEAEGALLRLPGHAASFSRAELDFWRKLQETLEARGPRPFAIVELARELRASEPTVAAMLQRRRLSGDIWQVTDSKFMLRGHVARLVALAAQIDANSGSGYTAAEFRDASGIGRNFVIQLLEFFDRIGVTRRVGAARRMRGDWEAVVGTAN